MIAAHTRLYTAAVLATALVGCASAPPEHFYALRAMSGPAVAPTRLHVEVSEIAIPEFINRPQLVLGADDSGAVRFSEQERWAEPIASSIGRVLAQDLGQRLGTAMIEAYPAAVLSPVDFRVSVDLKTFAPTGDRVAIEAIYSVRRISDASASGVQTGQLSANEPLPQASAAGVVDAESRLLGRLSDAIAATVRNANPPAH